MLREENLSAALIDMPNTVDEQESMLRARILGRYRGYAQNREMFEDFPTDMTWQWIEFERAVLTSIKYINGGMHLTPGTTRYCVVSELDIRHLGPGRGHFSDSGFFSRRQTAAANNPRTRDGGYLYRLLDQSVEQLASGT